LTPLNACDAAGVGAAAWEADAAALGAVDATGAELGGALATGAELGDAGLQPAMTSINPTTGAMVLNRDTGVLLLTRQRFVQHTERLAVG
jgi:hypothetical protein